jgi:type IV pilus assembly protein PilM
MFNLGKSTVLGIDFGASSIKAVELLINGQDVELLNFGEVNLKKIEDGLPENAPRTFDEEMTLRLRALLREMKVSTKNISMSIPAYVGLVSLAEFPFLEDRELASAVQFEAKKYIPSRPEDIALSWDILHVIEPSDAVPGGKMQVLLTAALRKEIERYEKYLTDLGVEPLFEELEIFSLARALTRGRNGTEMLIDIGSKVTNLIVVQDGQVQANSTVSIGGKDITQTIADTMNIGKERADDLKKSGVDLLNSLESGIQFPALETILIEFKRLQELVIHKNPSAYCQEIILSGGGAQLSGLPTYFEKKMNMPVTIGDPWKGVKMPKNFVRGDYFDTQYTVALGVAFGQKDATVKRKMMGPRKGSSFLKMLNKKI